MSHRSPRPLVIAASLAALIAVPTGLTFVAPTLSPVAPAHAAPPAAKEGWYKNIVDTEFVLEHAQIPPKKGVVVIDSRPAARRYDIGHIPGAINIPDSQFDKLTDRLPADKNTLLLMYCGGLDCLLSHDSARKAEALGYTNIKVYAEGEPEWSKRGHLLSVSTAYIKKLLDEKDKGGEKFVLIDSRPKRVFDKGHIPGALNISDTDFDKNHDKLPADKATPLIFYCGGLDCVLSSQSAAKAKALGYTNVRTYAEGFPAWSKAYPDRIALPAGAAPAAVEAPAGSLLAAINAASAAAAQTAKKMIEIVPGKEKGSISAASFDKIVKEMPEQALLVDVRDAKEYAKGTIKGFVNLPINQLEKRIEELPKDKPVIFMCGTGARAGEAYDAVKLLRPEVQAYFFDADLKIEENGGYTVIKAR